MRRRPQQRQTLRSVKGAPLLSPQHWGMPDLERHRQLLELRQKTLRAEFVEVELDLAITFCQIALSTNDADKIGRNSNNAELAYESAIHFLQGDGAPETLEKQIQEKLNKLKRLLEEIRAKAPS